MKEKICQRQGAALIWKMCYQKILIKKNIIILTFLQKKLLNFFYVSNGQVEKVIIDDIEKFKEALSREMEDKECSMNASI